MNLIAYARASSIAVALLLATGGICFAQGVREERSQFLSLLGERLLGETDNSLEVAGGRGWLTFATSPFGSSTESLVEAYAEVDQRFAYSVAREATVDAVVSVHDGVVVFYEESLPSVWGTVLSYSRPRGSIGPDRFLSGTTLRWLFRPTGALNDRGEQIYSREPSRFLRRYNEFRSEFFRLLDLEGNDAWKYVAPFNRHASFQQAMNAHLHEWETAGYKREVESAQLEFGHNAQPFLYRRWFEANAKYDYYSSSYGGTLRAFETLILPSPSSWPGLVDWKNVRYRPDGLGGEFRFQVAVIDIRRPWMDLDFLFDVSGLDDGIGGARVQLSQGIAPSFGATLSGRFVGLIRQIVLVRGIDWIDPNSLAPIQDRPIDSVLGKFAYPQSINVLGYIVHVLPDISVPVDLPDYLLASDEN